MFMFNRIMQTPKGLQIEVMVNELIDKFKNYLIPLFNKWKHVTPKQIREKILYPLFTINDDNTISLCFPNEVTILYYFNYS